jgi:hypothetical protein
LKVNEVEAKSILEETPMPMGITAMDKEVNNRFLGSFVKRTKATIRPPFLLQPVRRPKSILKRKPCKDYFCRRSSFPHQSFQVGVNSPDESRFLNRGRGVLAIFHKRPRDTIINLVIKMEMLKLHPKINKLLHMGKEKSTVI